MGKASKLALAELRSMERSTSFLLRCQLGAMHNFFGQVWKRHP